MARRQTAIELSTARQEGLHNIGEAAQQSGVSAKMIRHYESIGLMSPARRTLANYRIYTDNDVHTLRFIHRARTLGFSMKQIAQLLNLWRDRRRASAHVKRVALAHVQELDERIREMQQMRNTLEKLAAHCSGDERPECPILEDLAADGRAP